MDLSNPADYARRWARCCSYRSADTVVAYLATAPGAVHHFFCEQIGAAGLNFQPNVRVVLEKPLGHDLASNAINRRRAQMRLTKADFQN
jgi:glucose-6-phosphate 1-dehydrogenase